MRIANFERAGCRRSRWVRCGSPAEPRPAARPKENPVLDLVYLAVVVAAFAAFALFAKVVGKL
ncbi:hypothetical protein [Glutamicibacter mysorens]|uniref:hypothetical protein n=1 Tax=Glutamicibacter mysorens TaxID=257984 RepID=UPI0020C6A548|nr:hypothetical protein [Glutamicibacter mysorens]UTM45826.1 hypothetical protein XH9_09545 [Glutamicibacter mysorens]